MTIFPFDGSSCQMPASVRLLRSPRSRRAFLLRAFCVSRPQTVAAGVLSVPQRRAAYAASLSQARQLSSISSKCRMGSRTPRSRAVRTRECSALSQDPDRQSAAFRCATRCRAMCIEFRANSQLCRYRAGMLVCVGNAPSPRRARAASPLQGPRVPDLITHRRIRALIVLRAPRPPVELCRRICGSGRC